MKLLDITHIIIMILNKYFSDESDAFLSDFVRTPPNKKRKPTRELFPDTGMLQQRIYKKELLKTWDRCAHAVKYDMQLVWRLDYVFQEMFNENELAPSVYAMWKVHKEFYEDLQFRKINN